MLILLFILIGTLQSNDMLSKKPVTTPIIYNRDIDINKKSSQLLQNDSRFYDPSMMHKKVGLQCAN